MTLLQDSNNKSCIRRPLLHVDATSCPPDLLHLKKGIISKLLTQLVDWTVLQGREQALMQQIKAAKIHFRFGHTHVTYPLNLYNVQAYLPVR